VAGLRLAWRDLWSGPGLAFASPLVVFPVVYVLAYGLGALVYADRIGDRWLIFGPAVLIGLLAYLGSLGAAWRPLVPDRPSLRRRELDVPIRLVAFGMVAIGLAALVAYLIAAGGIPLFMGSVEQTRVSAAERGGAALRVISLLTLPGVWLLAGQAGASRRIAPLLGAGAIAALVTAMQLLTANRAPAFTLVQVAIVAALLSAGITRLRVLGLVLIGLLVAGLVIAAGAIGAYRLSATPTTWRDPQIARGVASGDLPLLTAKAIANYLVVPIQNFGATLDAVPSLIPWRYGYTYLQPLVTILPGKQTTFDQDLKAALEQNYAGGGTVPSMLGEAYANFGPIGWVLVPGAIGVLLGRLYANAERRRTVAARVLYAYALLHMANATISGIIVASVFPYLAYGILGAAVFAEPLLERVHRAAQTPPA
jgi:hypothetical protein